MVIIETNLQITILPCFVDKDWAIKHLRKTLLCGFSKHSHELSKLCLATLHSWIVSMTGHYRGSLKFEGLTFVVISPAEP